MQSSQRFGMKLHFQISQTRLYRHLHIVQYLVHDLLRISHRKRFFRLRCSQSLRLLFHILCLIAVSHKRTFTVFSGVLLLWCFPRCFLRLHRLRSGILSRFRFRCVKFHGFMIRIRALPRTLYGYLLHFFRYIRCCKPFLYFQYRSVELLLTHTGLFLHFPGDFLQRVQRFGYGMIEIFIHQKRHIIRPIRQFHHKAFYIFRIQ